MRRWLKAAAAGGLLLVAASGLLVDAGTVTADNAVVTAYVLPVRSPIAGQVSGLDLTVGAAVAAPGRAARVTDDQASDDRVVELKGELTRLDAEMRGVDTLRRELGGLRERLVARGEQHRVATIAAAAAAADEAAAQLHGRLLRLDLARRDLARKQTLARFGDVAAAEAERVGSEAGLAESELAAHAARQRGLQVRASAAEAGLLLDSGSGDVAYSLQRIDEIDLRLAELSRGFAGLAASRDAAALRLDAQQRRLAVTSTAELALPAGFTVWKLAASNRERVAAGDTLAQLVDCGAAFLVAAIPQRQFALVEIGAAAEFRLSGETAARHGRVMSVTGQSGLGADRALAATPAPESRATALVQVAVAPDDGACLVGRTARVLLPVNGGAAAGLAARLRAWLP